MPKVNIAQEAVSIKVVPTINYLPSTVYFVLRDAEEYIWISTNTGVYRYDGYNFTHFTSADGLGDNEILRIFQDSHGRIWFQSVNGNPSYYLNGKIYNATNSELIANLKFNKMILSECEDKEGNVYIGSRESLFYKIDVKDNVIKLKYGGHENFCWIDTQNKPRFVEKKFANNHRPLRGDANAGLVYATAARIVYQIVDDTIVIPKFELPEESEEIIFIKIKSANEIYLGTRHGLFIYYPNTSKPPRRFLIDHSVSSVEFDFEDNLWVSTIDAGLYIIPNTEINVLNKSNGFPEDKITSIEHDAAGNLWVGMSNDKYSVIKPDGSIDNYRLSISSTHDITNIRHFGDDTYIVGKSSIGKINKTGITNYAIYGNDIYVNKSDSVVLAQDNTIIINKTLFEYHIKEVVNNMVFRRQDYEFVKARTNVLKADKYGNLWIGTSKGAYYYHHILNYLGDQNQLLGSPVRDIAFDNNGFYTYIATLNGLLIIKDNILTKILDQHSGLPNSECNALFVDEQNYVWAAFGNELVRIKYTESNTEVINYSDIYKIEASRITDLDNIGDIMYLATETGLIYFNKNSDFTFDIKPKIKFSKFSVNNADIAIDTFHLLRYNENDLSISYSGISYLSKAEISYKYLLEGYDTAWHITNERTLHYKSLPPGNYNFKIAAINKSGQQSEPQVLNFEIGSPFWMLWWFWALMLIIFVAALFIIWRYRLNTLRQQYDQQNKTFFLEKENAEFEMRLTELSQQAFRQQMNPHFIFNALNTIKGYYAEGDVKKASDYISKFSKLLRNILENKDQIIPLEKEIQAIKLYLELAGMRYEKKFIYNVLTDDSLNVADVGIPPMLLQPFIENSLIHGISPKVGQGTLLIEFQTKGQQLICSITDDGIGRSASSLKSRLGNHNSKATILITEYLDALNNKENTNKFTLDIIDLYNKQGEAIGTRVILLMPLMQIENNKL